MNVTIMRSVFAHGLPEHLPPGWPLHRLTVEFADGVPVQGNHVAAPRMKRGIRDADQTYIDACRFDVAIAAAVEPSRPAIAYPEGTPMFVEVTSWIPRPAKLKPVHRLTQVALGGSGRGDGDKMCRFVWDALNAKAVGGAAWFADDNMIGEWSGRRMWADHGQVPRIEVAVAPLRASAPTE